MPRPTVLTQSRLWTSLPAALPVTLLCGGLLVTGCEKPPNGGAMAESTGSEGMDDEEEDEGTTTGDNGSDGSDASGSEESTDSESESESDSGADQTGDELDPFLGCNDVFDGVPKVEDVVDLRQNLTHSEWYLFEDTRLRFFDSGEFEIDEEALAAWKLSSRFLEVASSFGGDHPDSDSDSTELDPDEDSDKGDRTTRREETERFVTPIAIDGNSLYGSVCEGGVMRRVGEGTGLDGQWRTVIAWEYRYEEDGEVEIELEAEYLDLQIDGDQVRLDFGYCGAWKTPDGEGEGKESDTERFGIRGTPDAFDLLYLDDDDALPDTSADDAGDDDDDDNDDDWDDAEEGGAEVGDDDDDDDDDDDQHDEDPGEEEGPDDWGEEGDDSSGDVFMSGKMIDANTIVLDSLYAKFATTAGRFAKVDAYCTRPDMGD